MGSKFKELRRSYGFDEVAIVPGDVTINPEDVDISVTFGDVQLNIPILASAMDGVVDTRFATTMGKLGGLAVLNLDGVQARYDNPDEILAEIAAAPAGEVTALLQKAYSAPIKENLIGERVRAIKDAGVVAAVSCIPQNAKRFGPLAAEAGVDIFVVQSTVTTARHISKSVRGLLFDEFCKLVKVPVIVGNCVTYSACLELMQTGISGVLVGVGPGAACTTREVLGIGVPQVTATIDCAAARDDHFKATGKYVPIVTDGGIRTGGDVCKSFVAGADAVMMGSPFAQSEESPGCGNHWGMATPHPALPRGTRVKVNISGSLEQILFGPTSRTDGTQNFVGALRSAMGLCGAANVKEFQQAEMVIAPAIKTEGKIFQMAQGR